MKKAIILGLDGFDYSQIKKLISRGLLPNLAKLSKSGSFLSLKTTIPPESPVVWSTIATGKNPGEHGIFDFITKDKNNLPVLSIPKINKSFIFGGFNQFKKSFGGKSFWEVASDHKIQSTVIKWPCSFPAEKINGKILAGMGIPDPEINLGRYTLFTNKKINPKKIYKGKVVKLNFKNRIAEFNNLVFEIRSTNKISLMFNNERCLLEKNKWSDWIKTEKGISRFHLNSISPHFSLYQTAINPLPKESHFPISYPSNYLDSLFKELGYFHTLGIPEETNGIVDKLITKKSFIKFSEIIFSEREKLFWYEFNKFKQGIFAFVFDSTDRFQHIFGFGKETIFYYRKIDKIIGKIIKKISKDTLLMIISDHGFAPYKKSIHINSWLKKNGYLKFKNSNASPYLFENVDWEKTYAFALGFSSIYINKRNEGMFSRKDLRQKLLELTDSKNNKKVIKNIYLKEDVYHGKYFKNAPDFIIGTRPPYRVSSETAVGGTPKMIIEDNIKDWRFDHIVDPECVPGIFFSNKKFSQKVEVSDVFSIVLDFFKIKNYQ